MSDEFRNTLIVHHSSLITKISSCVKFQAVVAEAFAAELAIQRFFRSRVQVGVACPAVAGVVIDETAGAARALLHERLFIFYPGGGDLSAKRRV